MQIFRFKFVKLYREIVDHMMQHTTPSYSFILRMDNSIIELASSLPRHFEDPAELGESVDPALLMDSVFLNMQANIRLLRLHRPFFLRGYQDARYERSKSRCVESSRAVLGLVDVARRRAPNLLSFWIVLFFAFSAAVPVCIDLFFDPAPGKRNAVEQILNTFREHASMSSAARNSVFVLERLLELEKQAREAASPQDSHSGPSAKKRRLSGQGASSASGPSRKHVEVLRDSIKSILENAAFQQHQSSIPIMPIAGPPSESAPSESSFPLALTPTIALDDIWPTNSSFDTLDTLWVQSDGTTWPAM